MSIRLVGRFLIALVVRLLLLEQLQNFGVVLQVIQINPVHNFVSNLAFDLSKRLLVLQILQYKRKHRKGATIEGTFSESLGDTCFAWNIKSVGLDCCYCA